MTCRNVQEDLLLARKISMLVIVVWAKDGSLRNQRVVIGFSRGHSTH
jgi:hypothetical protein